MPPTPRPDGWKGGNEDFGIVRTLDGHIASPAPSADASDVSHNRLAESADYGRNERRGFDSADLSGDYDTSWEA